jgi:6-phosphofructokinase 1
VTAAKKLGILVGGGPAPGINSVIGAATIRGRLEGVEVIGSKDGFQWLMRGDLDHVVPLTIHEVSRIHFRGGSHLGISRANPTTDPQLLEKTIQSLLTLQISQLITIGGDDTYSAMRLEQKPPAASGCRTRAEDDRQRSTYRRTSTFRHRPRHVGVGGREPDGRREDHVALGISAIAMGRKAGISRSASARPPARRHADSRGVRTAAEEDRRHLVGAIKRLSEGRRYGVAILGGRLAFTMTRPARRRRAGDARPHGWRRSTSAILKEVRARRTIRHQS